MNSKGQVIDVGYDVFNTNEEGRQYTLKAVEMFKKMLDEAINKL